MCEIYIVKGEIKLIRYLTIDGNDIDGIPGLLELKLTAFINLHFSKFTGVISTKIHNTDIHRVWLRPLYPNTSHSGAKRLISRIYKKESMDLLYNGLSDRVLQEIVAT
jgi:hypothetical protein